MDKLDQLPPGWEEMFDDSSQRIFYYNQTTGESSWERPVNEIVDLSSSNSSNPGDWTELFSDDGRPYYYNATTGETSWEKPENASALGDLNKNENLASQLPPGWEEMFDDSSQRIFYYNQSTGESSWERPIADHNQEIIDLSSSNSSNPGDWTELFSDDGRPYYYNTTTGETTWEKPLNFSSNDANAADSATTVNSKLSLDIPSSRPFDRENSNDSNRSASSTNDKDKMSLYNAQNLHLPEYNKPEDPLNSSLRSNKRSGFVSAPDEFASEFLSMNARNDQRDRSDEDDYGNHDNSDLNRALDYLETIDWTEKNPTALSEVILSIPPSQLTTPAVLSYITKQLTSFTIASYAEAHFQFDRRGSSIPANMIDKLISYQSEPLKTSLTALPSNLASDAIHCFRQIQTFMSRTGVAKAGHKDPSLPETPSSAANTTAPNSSNPTATTAARSGNSNSSSSRATDTSAHMDIATYLIQNMAMASTEFNDEIYLQLCKQTRRNPSAESTELGWQLMLILLSSIPVSRRLLPYLMQYISVAVENLVDEAKKFAALCMKFVLKSAVSSPRRELPTDKEILSLLLGDCLDVRIKNIDKKVLLQPVDSFTLVADLETAVFSSLKISEVNRAIFGLFELCGGKPIAIATTDRVVDILSAWAANPRHITDAILAGDHGLETGNSFMIDENLIPRFLFRVKFFFPVEDEDDHVTLDLLYAQALHDCLTAHYPHTLQDALLLSAFQLQILNGDFIVGKEIKEFRSSSSIKSLCVAPWIDREEITRAEAEAKITALYKRLANTARIQARNMALKYIQSWKLYGAKYFLVKGHVDGGSATAAATAHELILAVNLRSVIVIDPTYLSVLADYTFDQIHSWGHSFDSFALAVGAKESQSKSYFRTSQGKEIEELLRIYSSHMSKRHNNSMMMPTFGAGFE